MGHRRRHSGGQRFLSAVVSFAFFFNSIFPSVSFAQAVPEFFLNLPNPGVMVKPTGPFDPALLRGITIHPENPLLFDFLMDKGQTDLPEEDFRKEALKQIKYFLASLTIPEDEVWVNLSPYEKDRMIADEFGKTEMGRDMLAQDYLLKQLTASLIYPEDQLGKTFWDRVYQKAKEQFGTTEIPINTFNKVWIVPSKATVYENGANAFILDSHLEVMLEEDYLALENNLNQERLGTDKLSQGDVEKLNSVSSQIVKEVLLPEIEKEVNYGETFANLRQIYNAMILATWYKIKLKNSLLGKIYVDQNKTKGIETADPAVKEKIYNQYLEAFQKGVYDYIKEDYDPSTEEVIARRYVSGGVNFKRPNGTKLAGILTAALMVAGSIFASPSAAQVGAFEAREENMVTVESGVVSFDQGKGVLDSLANPSEGDVFLLADSGQGGQKPKAPEATPDAGTAFKTEVTAIQGTFKKAGAEFEKKNWDESAKIFAEAAQKARALAKRLETDSKLRGTILNPDSVASNLKELAQTAEDNAASAQANADATRSNTETSQAGQSFQQRVDQMQGVFDQGTSLFDQGKYAEAKAKFEETALNGEGILKGIGTDQTLRRSLEDPSKAAADMRKFIQTARDNAKAAEGNLNGQEQEGKNQKIFEQFNTNNRQVVRTFNEGIGLLNSGHPQEAIVQFKKAKAQAEKLLGEKGIWGPVLKKSNETEAELNEIITDADASIQEAQKRLSPGAKLEGEGQNKIAALEVQPAVLAPRSAKSHPMGRRSSPAGRADKKAKSEMLQRLANNLRDVADKKFTLIVESDMEKAPSEAWVTVEEGEAKPTIHITSELLDSLEEGELAFILGHEIAHPSNNDFKLAKQLKQLGGLKRYQEAYALIDAHEQIEADKRSVEYLEKLGYKKEAALRAMEKINQKRAIPSDSFTLRIKILQDRIDKPDSLSDFYMLSESALGVLALGFRFQLRDDIEESYQRAEDILNLYNVILNLVEDFQGDMDTILEKLKKKIAWHEDPSHWEEDTTNRGLMLETAFNIAFIDMLSESLDQENKDSKESPTYLFYRDTLKDLKSKLELVLERMSQTAIQTATVRERTDKTGMKKYFPTKGIENLPVEFPYEVFAKFLKRVTTMRIAKNVLEKEPIIGTLPEEKILPVLREKPKKDRRWWLVLLPLFVVLPRCEGCGEEGPSQGMVPAVERVENFVPTGRVTIYNPFSEDHSGQAKKGDFFDLDGSNFALMANADGRVTAQDGGWIAVDPKVIPLNSKVTITFADGNKVAYKTVDTGGAVKGHRIDLSINKDNSKIRREVDDLFDGAIVETEDGDKFVILNHGPKGGVTTITEEVTSWREEVSLGDQAQGNKANPWKHRFLLVPIPLFGKKKPKEESPQATQGRPGPSPAADLEESVIVRTDVTGRSAGAKSHPMAQTRNPGGIDFNPILLNMEIRRDENGVPLPLLEQPSELINTQGFVPFIIQIQPVTNLPLLLGLNPNEPKEPVNPDELGYYPSRILLFDRKTV